MTKSASVDELGNPYDYIVVIDAGSKGSRAHLYRAKQYNPTSKTQRDDDSDSDDGDTFEDIDKNKLTNFPQIELVRRKKVKPGIASFASNPKKLGSKYVGKLLNDMEKYIPQDQISRTPVFLHATGGMRLLKPEEQDLILNEICSYIQKHSKLYLPDCSSHVNSISGETEGLYSWIGLNYRYDVFDQSLKSKSTYGALDMGGVSTQMAFEPSNIEDEQHADYLYKVDLNFLNPQDESIFSYKIFSQSFLGGINQAHLKYDEKLIEQNTLIDPCLPMGYIKTVTSRTGEKVDIEGSSDFTECVKSLFDVLSEISVDKYCNLTDSQTTTSCLLSDSLPKMTFNEKKFVGINEFYSNLKEFLNYKDCYMKAQKMCSMSYTDMLSESKLPDDEVESEKTSEVCFKSAWIINVLHQGLDFPRYGIDAELVDEQTYTPDFTVLDGFSWTLGRAVLYTFYETALRLDNSSVPRIGYFEPSSQVFVPGGEALGVPMRPEYVVDYYNADDMKDYDNDNDDEDHDDDKDNDDWDYVSDHRLWGSLSFLLVLMIAVYLLLGKTKRQSIFGAFYQMLPQQLKSRINYTPLEAEDLELGGDEDDILERGRRDDSFEIE